MKTMDISRLSGLAVKIVDQIPTDHDAISRANGVAALIRDYIKRLNESLCVNGHADYKHMDEDFQQELIGMHNEAFDDNYAGMVTIGKDRISFITFVCTIHDCDVKCDATNCDETAYWVFLLWLAKIAVGIDRGNEYNMIWMNLLRKIELAQQVCSESGVKYCYSDYGMPMNLYVIMNAYLFAIDMDTRVDDIIADYRNMLAFIMTGWKESYNSGGLLAEFYTKKQLEKKRSPLNSAVVNNVLNEILRMICNIGSLPDTNFSIIDINDICIIHKELYDSIDAISTILINATSADCSVICNYINAFADKSPDIIYDTTSPTYDLRKEFLSDVDCIVEDYEDHISETERMFYKAVESFKAATSGIKDLDTSTIYETAVKYLEELITAKNLSNIDIIRNKLDLLVATKKVQAVKTMAVDKDGNVSSGDSSEQSASAEEAGDKSAETETAHDTLSSDHISWNEYFMELAETAAKRSKDPKSKVGACIMDPKDHRVVSLGYNGFPYGCSDDEFPWTREGDDNKYLYVVHAELNAILSARKDLSDCVLFVTYSPCNECMKAIIQSGIKLVVYKNEYKAGTYANIASTKMAKAAGVQIVKYDDIEVIKKECDKIVNSYTDFLKNVKMEK